MNFRARHVFAFLFFLIGLFLFGILVGHTAYDIWHHDLQTALSMDQGELLFYTLWLWGFAYLLAFYPFRKCFHRERESQ